MFAAVHTRRRLFGGILWDLFLILVLCAGGFMVWRTRAEWGRWFLQLRGSGQSGAAPVKISPAITDLGRRSAGAQAGVRQFLSESGLREKDILKSYNEERHAEGSSWLESTLEIARPAGFRSGPFLKRLLGFLSQSGLALMRDETEGGRWTLDVGDRDHVFQRLVIHDR